VRGGLQHRGAHVGVVGAAACDREVTLSCNRRSVAFA
jgi:hypothetical protein